ncbi:MAG: hypothetical protein K2O32_01590 [Acetatifactor sp.]|nr:hypothetical protein [Acetatifactor sp.]
MNGISEIILGDKIDSGSNSNLYEIVDSQDVNFLVAKCSRNAENYVSFNLQYHSYLTCQSIFNTNEYIIPQIYLYKKQKGIGDILVMEKIEDFFNIDFVVNGSFYYGDIVIKRIAKAIAWLHNNGISGFDIELYWNIVENKLVLLDIGPMFTFDVSYEEMLFQHWRMEKENDMGKWNIISQILSVEESKQIFKSQKFGDVSLEYIVGFVDWNTMSLHIENVAKVHALYIFGKLSKANRKKYLDIFLEEYKKNIIGMSINNIRYMKELQKVITENITKAKAKLYYSTMKTLSEESCSIELSGP